MANKAEVDKFISWLEQKFTLGYRSNLVKEYGRRTANVGLYVRLNFDESGKYQSFSVTARIYAIDICGSIDRLYVITQRHYELSTEYIEKCIGAADSMEKSIVGLGDQLHRIANKVGK
jgi:hypothetical protein